MASVVGQDFRAAFPLIAPWPIDISVLPLPPRPRIREQGSLELSFSGYSDKMKVLLERVVQRLASFAESLAPGEGEGQGDEGIGSTGDGGGGGLAMFERVRQVVSGVCPFSSLACSSV